MTLALGQIDRKYVRVVHTPQILSISLVLTIRLILLIFHLKLLAYDCVTRFMSNLQQSIAWSMLLAGRTWSDCLALS